MTVYVLCWKWMDGQSGGVVGVYQSMTQADTARRMLEEQGSQRSYWVEPSVLA